jgi:fused signal recognition particle receptor
MAERVKLTRISGKSNPVFPRHRWIIADANLRTDTIISAKKFHEEPGLKGMVMTKVDGTSRGGAIVGIYEKCGIPVSCMGTSESHTDLVAVVVNEYADGLVGRT